MSTTLCSRVVKLRWTPWRSRWTSDVYARDSVFPVVHKHDRFACSKVQLQKTPFRLWTKWNRCQCSKTDATIVWSELRVPTCRRTSRQFIHAASFETFQAEADILNTRCKFICIDKQVTFHTEFNNFLVKMYSCAFKFRKVLRQQTWGEVVVSIAPSCRPENTTVKELLKSVYICQSYFKNKRGHPFLRHSVYNFSIVICHLFSLTSLFVYVDDIRFCIHAKGNSGHSALANDRPRISGA